MNFRVKFNNRKAVKQIYVITLVVLSILSYALIEAFIQKVKIKQIVISSKYYPKKDKLIYFNAYKNKIENQLFNLEYPYKISLRKYLFLKYVFSLFILLISIINYRSIFVPLVLFLISFFVVDYLLYSYKKNEKIQLINELRKLISSLILCLTSYTSLKDALKISIEALDYKRFKEAYKDFIYFYEMSGFNINQASKKLEDKFSSYELNLFLSVLRQSEREGNLLENLEKCEDTLNFNYFKYLKRKSATRLLYVALGTVLSLINIILIVMYPIFIQVVNNLKVIFT